VPGRVVGAVADGVASPRGHEGDRGTCGSPAPAPASGGVSAPAGAAGRGAGLGVPTGQVRCCWCGARLLLW